jgi:hypothetical protein
MTRPALALLVFALAAPAAPLRAADVFGAYSRLRLDRGHVSGGELSFGWPQRGALGLVTAAAFHGGSAAGEEVRELALLSGPAFTLGRGRRLSAFVHTRGGLARERRQVVVFGVAIGPGGVCAGGCPSKTAFAAEAGAGLDLRLGARWSLRLAQADWRLTRAEGEADRRLRLSAGLVWRSGR